MKLINLEDVYIIRMSIKNKIRIFRHKRSDEI